MLLSFLLVSFSAASVSSSSKLGFNKRITFVATIRTCCMLLLLGWSKSLQHTGRFVTTARAWSVLSAHTGISHLKDGTLDRKRFLTGSALAATNGDSGEEEVVNGNGPKPSEGKTGWNHNPPKNPDFWNTAEQVEAISKSIQKSESPKSKLRTGWLHNTESPVGKGNKGNSRKGTATQKNSNAAGKARRRLEEAMKAQTENHRIVSPGALHASGTGRLIVVTEHRMSVPIVHPEPGAGDTPPGSEGGAAAALRPTMSRQVAAKDCIDVAFKIVEEVKDEDTRVWYETVFPTLTPTQRAKAYVKRCKMTSANDMLLYLQGGPGFGAPSPVTALCFSKGGSSWGCAALDKYSRVVLLDQRGTGMSSPLTKQSIEQRFPGLFALDQTAGCDEVGSADFGESTAATMDRLQQSHPEAFESFRSSLDEATAFLAQFRADNIVKDAELVKNVLMFTPSVDDEDNEDEEAEDTYDPKAPNPWGCSLGQSFGGFCTMTYLSQIPHPPKICLLTGGIAPMLADSAVDVYTSLWKKVKERTLSYYDMYPGDVEVVRTIVRSLLRSESEGRTPRLPSGGKLTARRFLQLGMSLGGSPSSFASMHDLLSSAFLQPLPGQGNDNLQFCRGFLKAIDHWQPFDEYPIYYWLHESIYADGPTATPGLEQDADCATNWSANSAYRAKVDRRSNTADEYNYEVTSAEDSDRPVLFFGEMVFPWMTDDYQECGGLGCTALAHALAAKSDWGPLYNASKMRAALSEGKTRCAAAVYYDDMYVDFDCSMQVTARGGPLEKCKVYITNDYQHSGIRDDGATLFNKLHGMATGSVRTPS